MNTKRIIGLILAVWALVAFVIPASGIAADEATDPSIYFRPAVRFGTDDRTLFILDFLIPVYRGNKDLIFINTKFTPDNREAWETNLGVGYRRLVAGDRLVLGGNLFYDHRKTRYGSHFDQIGLGFEAMAEPGGVGLATRFNYYQPLTRAKLGEDFGYVFYGNGIYTAGIEEPLTGFDYEAGIRIPGVSDYVETWVYAGGYHFFGCHVPDVNGVSARIEAMPTDFLRLNFEFRNDSVNHDQYYGEVAFEVPFSIENLVAGKNPFEGIGDVLTGSRSLKERMVEPVRRDVDIVVGKDYLSPSDAAADGNLAAGVIFVADNADDYPGTPDGSFEHPYAYLELAESNLNATISIIHVLPGDGRGTSGYIFDTPGLTIWGAGAANPAYPNVLNFVEGYPLITSTLNLNGANMTVLGLNFDVSDYAAISIGGSAFESGLSIFKNRILNDGEYGIWFEGPDGIGTADSPVCIWGNTISVEGGSTAKGIYLESYSGDIYARVFDNQLNGIRSEEYASGIEIIADNGYIHGSITGNTINNIDAYGGGYTGATGISVFARYDFLGSISGNTITTVYADGQDDASAYGIYAEAGNDLLGDISGNTVGGVSAISSGWSYINAYGIYGSADGDFLGDISRNTIGGVSASGTIDFADAYGIYGRASGDFLGDISRNTVGGVSASSPFFTYSCWIRVSAGGDFLGDISRNTVGGVSSSGTNYAYAYGIYGFVGGDFLGDISGNTVGGVSASGTSNAYAYGIYRSASGDFLGDIINNYIEVSSGDRAYGLYAYSYSGSLGTVSSPLVFTGNSGTVSAPAAYMAWLEAANPGASNVYIGSGKRGMGDNSFTSSAIWSGNYPWANGPIWATDNGSFIHP